MDIVQWVRDGSGWTEKQKAAVLNLIFSFVSLITPRWDQLEELPGLRDVAVNWAAALERLNFIYPVDTALHEHLGSLYLETGNPPGAVREFDAALALHPIDMAGGHYNLARALKAAGQTGKAREEAINALEAAPDFRPAQKLLLELSGPGH